MNQLSFIIVRNILFYNIVDSVNMDMLGFGSLQEVRVLCIIGSTGLRYLVTMEANAFSILIKCDLTFFFVQKSTVFLNSLLPSKSKSV